jgi:hypothetical protein
METMAQTAAEAWLEEGKVKGRLEANRATLKRQLTAKFGPLPAALQERIDATLDPGRLDAALDQVLTLQSLDELKL